MNVGFPPIAGVKHRCDVASGTVAMPLLQRLTSDQKRTFLHWGMELVVVIAGVLIALWVQQWADRRRAKEEMVAAEEAIHAEVRMALTQLIWRDAISKCHIERAEKLKSMLLAGGRDWPGLDEDTLVSVKLSEATGVQTVVPGVYQRPSDSFATAAWESALATGALAPMDRQRFAQLVDVYAHIEFLKSNRDRQDRAAATLSGLSLPQEITPDTRSRMLGALYEVDTARFMFKYAGAAQLADSMKKLGWNDKAAIDRYISEGEAADRKRAAKWRACVSRERNPFD